MDFWNDFVDQLNDVFVDLFSTATLEGLTNLVLGLLVVIAFWLVARLLSWIVYRALHRVRTDERIGKIFGADSEAHKVPVERWVSLAVFYIVMLIGLIYFFDTLNLDAVSGPMEDLLSELVNFIPSLLGALMILFAAWVIATILRTVITQALSRTNIDERISETAHLGKDSVSHSLAQGIYWLVFLFFLPAILDQLELGALVEPVNDVIGNILSGIPKLLSAAIIVFLGWVLARIVRQIVTNLLDAANVDRFGEQIGLAEGQSISNLLGLIVYIIVFIPAIIEALNQLELEAISGPAIRMLDVVYASIQNLVGAFVIIVVAYYIGKLLSGFVTNVLSGVGFDSVPEKIGFNYKPAKGQRTLSEMVGYLVMVVAILLASIQAALLLGIDVLADSLQGFLEFGGQAIGALIILAVGIYLANLIRSIILSAGGEHANVFARAARVIVLVFVVVIAINQLDIGGVVVTSAFTIILGAIGVAVALAFGLGARDIAGKQVETWVKNWKK